MPAGLSVPSPPAARSYRRGIFVQRLPSRSSPSRVRTRGQSTSMALSIFPTVRRTTVERAG